LVNHHKPTVPQIEWNIEMDANSGVGFNESYAFKLRKCYHRLYDFLEVLLYGIISITFNTMLNA